VKNAIHNDPTLGVQSSTYLVYIKEATYPAYYNELNCRIDLLTTQHTTEQPSLLSDHMFSSMCCRSDFYHYQLITISIISYITPPSV